MNSKEFVKNSTNLLPKPVILVAPLDWGLGHATRCIPLIRQWEEAGFSIIIGAEGNQKAILAQEFPHIQLVDLKGYRLQYGHSRAKTILKLFLSIPKILISIKQEKQWLSRFLKKNKVDIVFSDNRYGFYNASIRSIFMTHQLNIKIPFGGFFERMLQLINYRFINRFSECWVPDCKGENNLAGELSHANKLPSVPTKYIGTLTRFKKEIIPIKYKLMIILSGPEPQRSLLEDICIRELKDYHQSVLLVRGLPREYPPVAGFNAVTICNHLPSQELNLAMNASGIIIARSGYSTIMDAMQLNKPCIFIPTPGQTEQAYLADYLSQKKFCISFDQHKFSLTRALNKLEQRDIRPFEKGCYGDYKMVILDLAKNYCHVKGLA